MDTAACRRRQRAARAISACRRRQQRRRAGSRVSSVQRPKCADRAARSPTRQPRHAHRRHRTDPDPTGSSMDAGGAQRAPTHSTARRSGARERAHLRDEFDDVREEAADARRRHLCGVPARRIGRARQMAGADRCARPPPVVQRCTEQAPEPLCYGSHLHTVVDDLDEHLLVLRAVLLQSARAVVRRPPRSTEPAVLVGSAHLRSPRVASASDCGVPGTKVVQRHQCSGTSAVAPTHAP
jgi:hypothetical protein